jgi:hypothetical protein
MGQWKVSGSDSLSGEYTGTVLISAAKEGNLLLQGSFSYTSGKQFQWSARGSLSGRTLTYQFVTGPGIIDGIGKVSGEKPRAKLRFSGKYRLSRGGRKLVGGWHVEGSERSGRGVWKRCKPNVKILDILDIDGRSVASGRSAFDIKRKGESPDGKRKCRIRYEVLGAAMKVTITVRCTTQKAFYKNPVVATILEGEMRNPGVHEILWDGRDSSEAKRILLGGKYDVQIRGENTALHARPRHSRRIKVAHPAALGFGPRYPAGWLTKDEPVDADAFPAIMKVKTKLRRLSDRSRFAVKLHEETTAAEALNILKKKCSVFFYDGHGEEGGIFFYSNAKDEEVVDGNTSFLCTKDASGSNTYHAAKEGYVTTILPARGKPLRDVFLVTLYSCEAGGGKGEVNMADHLIKLGADMVIAFSKAIFSDQAIPFQTELYERLAAGENIEEAARAAAKHADRLCADYFTPDDDCMLQACMVIRIATNLKDPYTLIPARYGCSTN